MNLLLPPTSNARFAKALEAVLRHEGGFVDDPADPGGATNMGITIATLQRWRSGRAVTATDVAALTPDEAALIYRAWYWDVCRCGEMPEAIALLVFDAAVNQGVSAAAIMLQQAARAKADGIVGPLTLHAVRSTGNALLHEYTARRAVRYARTRNVERFGLGWMRRLMDMYRRALDIDRTA